jgi:hypothetical protein
VVNNMSWSRTAAIEVCLTFNFAVFFLCSSVSAPLKQNEKRL